MNDTTSAGRPVGRTRWRRFGAAAAVGLGAVGALGYAAASGALPVSFAFSGIPFQLSADSLTGNHFVQYAYPDRVATNTGGALQGAAGQLINGPNGPAIDNTRDIGGNTYVSDTVTQLRTATIANLAQSICAPATPLPVAIRVTIAGTGDTTANDLVIQAPALTANSAAFKRIIIGEAVKQGLSDQGFAAGDNFTDPYGALSGAPIGNSFAQGADSVTLTKINQIGIGTEAGTFNIGGLKLYAEFVDHC